MQLPTASTRAVPVQDTARPLRPAVSPLSSTAEETR